ncbi:MAG: putative oligopeptide transporter [Parachlamydiales bacterium]|nr:putative oligopeptide transporter [Parachlamydiales bacterium]
MSGNESFVPHISTHSNIREFSLRATILGMIFGFFFAIANAYLALKIGQTISASIPAAILSMGLMKIFFRNTTILEHNIVQTIATVGEGLAAGVVFTIPALFFLGESPSIGRIFLLSSLGGILGILFMIPMRRFIIVDEHRKLPFPEGTACAEILKAGEKSSKSAIMAVYGLIVSGLYKIATNALFLWKETPAWTYKFFHNTQFSIDTSPALLGVGYICGARISTLMFTGGALGWWIIIPLIKMFGLGATTIYPSQIPVADLSADDIWGYYVRYIGAGTVAIGGMLSLVRIAPLIYKTIKVSAKELTSGFFSRAHLERTDRDISMAWLILGSVATILALWLIPGLPMNFFTIVLLTILGFFFVAVTSLTVGLVGSSSNPVSGMTITTLLITCIVFVLLGWTERIYLISAITMGCVASTAICMASTTSQDLKTGFLLGATPRSQQLAEIVGILIPSLALGYTIYILNAAYQIGSSLMPAPQAMLMSIIANGVINGELPYSLVIIGILIGLVLALLRVQILPFAIGLYLPLSLSTAIMVGGLARAIVDRKSSSELAQERGILLSSGLVGGDAILGVIIALLTIVGLIPETASALLPDYISLGMFLALGLGVAIWTLYRQKDRPYPKEPGP